MSSFTPDYITFDCCGTLIHFRMTAHDLGIENKVFVNRGHGPAIPFYGYTEVADIGGLATSPGV